MSVRYRSGRAHYDCSASRVNHLRTPACRSVKASVVDELVARRLLQALAPQEIALALAAADEVQARRARSNRALELRVERARYDAARAERAFHRCDPDNRLVARSLETRWEQTLREIKDAEAELAEHTTPAPEPSREQIEAVARDLPKLWAAETTSEKDRKRLLRAVIADVTITSQPAGSELRVGIRWRSGAAEQHPTRRPPSYNQMTRTSPETVVLIAGLVAEHTNAEIAAELNAAGLRTGKGLPFNAHAVRHIRRVHHIPAARRHDLTVNQLAERLGVSRDAIYYWIRHGQLAARRNDTDRLRIPFDPEVEQECRKRIANSSHIRTQTQIPATGRAV
jgi:excisionase family DNA binding protein